MFIKQQERGSVLGVCVTPASFTGKSGALDYRAVQSGRRAIDMLRLVRCDLLLVNLHLPDLSVWNFMRHVKTNWPQQKWALVGGPLSTQQEIAARMFNVCTFFDAPPAIDDVCQWRDLSDVKRCAQKHTEPAAIAQELKAFETSSGTVFNRSKHTPTFEITGSFGAHAAGTTYAKNTPIGAV
jgi:CheY-like chemotaxis protein